MEIIITSDEKDPYLYATARKIQIYIYKRFKFDEEIFNEWQSSGIGFEGSITIPQHHDQEEYLCGVFLTKMFVILFGISFWIG